MIQYHQKIKKEPETKGLVVQEEEEEERSY